MPFIDVYMPDEVPGYPCISSPRTRTTIQVSSGGGERPNQDWVHPLYRFIIPEAVARDWSVVDGLKKHWLITSGPYRSFPWRDPHDKASCDLLVPNEPDAAVIARLTDEDQEIGVADTFTDTFQLIKAYTVSGHTYTRTIHLPVVSTVVVAMDGVAFNPADYTVSRPGGEIIFDDPPVPVGSNDGIITAGFLYDNEVRFESDDAFEAILRTWQASGFADITLIEKRPC